ncbi:unnamed protein product [Clavelina lepadiformis]|uniref:Malonyl-CoA:ACP transacylase (MAT) domain-containing protein n=1 Tax=Clavelina lepadiformis TaxID=159417 RepID=A0ABP0FVV8_CLALP
MDVSNLLQEELVSQFESTNTKPKIDPEEKTIVLFPGQGSQKVGMVDDLLQYPNVKEIFSVASEILNFDLLRYCQNGPQSKLDRTVHCQPAIMVTSLAGIEKLQVVEPKALENCCACAGYSIGEFPALVFSGALSFEDAMKLVSIRSRAMQNASNRIESQMVTAYGSANTKFKLSCEAARDYCQQQLTMDNPICNVSAYLAPNIVTLAGHAPAVNYIKENMNKFGIRKIFPIPVSGAFHTKIMYEALPELKAALKSIHINQPLIQVYSNLSGKVYHDPDEIRESLPRQIINPVQWEQITHKMLTRSNKESMPTIYDVGPGNQLESLLKKCNGKAWRNYIPVKALCK